MQTQVRQTEAEHPDLRHVEAPTDRLVVERGRWITNWQPENPEFWEGPGRPTARTNLIWSVFCEFLGLSLIHI